MKGCIFLIAMLLVPWIGQCAFSQTTEQQSQQQQEPVPLHKHPTIVAMLAESNAQRASVGLPAQTMSPKLCQAAQFHALYMARTGDFRHEANLGLSGRAKKFDFTGSYYENIAAGQRSIKQVFKDWRESPPHWKAITSKSVVAGFGYTIAKDGKTYWVSMYGRPSP